MCLGPAFLLVALLIVCPGTAHGVQDHLNASFLYPPSSTLRPVLLHLAAANHKNHSELDKNDNALVVHEIAPMKTKMNLTVGYLTAAAMSEIGSVKGEFQGLSVSGAISMALDEINQDPNILPNVTLVLKWSDTRGDTVVATKAMTDMICEGVYAFFGPEGTCHVEAIVAQSINIPMISYKCSDYKASQVPTFARTEPPDTQVTKSIISFLDYYKWNKFSIVYEEDWFTVAQSLMDQAILRNMTINTENKVMPQYECCARKLKCCHMGHWYQLLQDTKNKTRIYVFLGATPALNDFTAAMQNVQLFENGEYIVIYVDSHVYMKKEAYKYLISNIEKSSTTTCEKAIPDFNAFLKRGKSLFVIVPTAPTENYDNFTEQVRKYNDMEPFHFNVPNLMVNKYAKFVSIYAAYLYDSVKLYSSALDKLLSEKPLLNEQIIDGVAKNGTKIIETIVKMKSYRSITGAMMKLDANGDSEGNFSVITFRKIPGDTQDEFRLPCSYQMIPIGQFFQRDDNEFPEYKILQPVDWVGNGEKPNDEPSCGFNNELCLKPNTHLNSIIAVVVLSVLLFCVGVITMSIYRKWKIEQEIEGLLWKIDKEEILMSLDKEYLSSPSRKFGTSQISLVSASVTSYESRGGLQVFAETAMYRGVLVRIRDLSFSRKKDISRETMKEMRLLRELRHDNVNSFIGACVEPNSLLLVTDYCAKGSLYDIIENEDIKLEKIFIASLVHDLIKGMLYIHNSMLVCHGNLKSSNCVVTSRWVLQVTDFGLSEIRHCAENDSIGEHQYYRNLFWKAPEILRNPSAYKKGSQKGDVYAFAIILFEILGRRGPFGNITEQYEPKDIISLVKCYPEDGNEPFRPDIDILHDCELGYDGYIIDCMTECWADNPDLRPDFLTIRGKLKRMKDGKKKNIMDQMMDMMEVYATNLEGLVTERTTLLHEEKKKTEDLLNRMLPRPVSERLTRGDGVEPESFDLVTVYFSDIVGFTAMSAESTPLQVVNFLNDLYTLFDGITKGYDVYKVETIGDAYVVVSGLPLRNDDRHAGEIASMALDMLSAVKNYTITHRPNDTLKLRIGIHTGPVVAGVVGLTMPRYCLFGDTVNTASRMESNGLPLRIHTSSQCKDALEKLGGYIIEERGFVSMKGKGDVKTYWLTGATEKAIKRREVDLEELPPLFCRPRRSPKLNNESRQPSFCGGFGGMTSRRHSSVPRGTSIEVESTSTIQNASPLPSRHLKVTRHLNVPEQTGSKLTINTAFGSQLIEVPEETKRCLLPRRVLSSIASSSDEHNKSQCLLNKVRESRSLDPLPVFKNKPLEYVERFLKGTRRSTKSLENCEKCGNIQVIDVPNNHIVNNNFANGNVVNITHEDNSFMEDAQVPLLNPTPNPIIIKRGGNPYEEALDSETSKRWGSPGSVQASFDVNAQNIGGGLNKKNNSTRNNSFRNWLISLFNSNGIKSGSTSLKKAVLNDCSIQIDKESVL